jgi:hypothetical protein
MATKRKVRRFAEGEFIDTESESGEWAGDEDYGDGTTRAERVAMARAPGYKSKGAAKDDDDMAMRESMGRAHGYHDEKASEPGPMDSSQKLAKSLKGAEIRTAAPAKKAAAPAMGGARNTRSGASASEMPAPAKSAGAGRGGRGGPTADELEAYAKERTAKKKSDEAAYAKAEAAASTPAARSARKEQEAKQGLEAVRPEEMLLPGAAAGLKAVGALAKGLAGRTGAKGTSKLSEYSTPQLSAPVKRLTGPGAKDAATDVTPKMLPGPTRALPAPAKAAPAEKAVSSKGREEVTNPLMWAAGPKNASKFKEAAKKKPKKPLREDDTSGGAVGYKKGGSVRGWGMARGARKAKIV